ncbi:hypothetical protein HanIR_Chr03g0135651 [Helianthus annuus]|nr:hypothetical protein HanIR_Chr03g0135651 [Helianthus annuus]
MRDKGFVARGAMRVVTWASGVFPKKKLHFSLLIQKFNLLHFNLFDFFTF